MSVALFCSWNKVQSWLDTSQQRHVLPSFLMNIFWRVAASGRGTYNCFGMRRLAASSRSCANNIHFSTGCPGNIHTLGKACLLCTFQHKLCMQSSKEACLLAAIQHRLPNMYDKRACQKEPICWAITASLSLATVLAAAKGSPCWHADNTVK